VHSIGIEKRNIRRIRVVNRTAFRHNASLTDRCCDRVIPQNGNTVPGFFLRLRAKSRAALNLRYGLTRRACSATRQIFIYPYSISFLRQLPGMVTDIIIEDAGGEELSPLAARAWFNVGALLVVT
jgi:hypothetical protein